MPTYEYACKSCGEHLEVVQSFKDEALTVCPACEGPLRKVFGSIGIAFKGSGFYRTDSRSNSSSPGSKSSSESSKPAAESTSKPASESSSSSTSGSSEKSSTPKPSTPAAS